MGQAYPKRGEEVYYGNHHAKQKNILEAKRIPDDSAHQRGSDGEDVVNGHGGGQRGLDVVGLHGDLFHVGRARHADREDHLVDQEAGAHHQKGSVSGEDEFGKSVAEADKDKDDRFRSQHHPLAEFIDCPAEQRLEENPDHAADGEERRHDLSRLFQHADQHPGREGDEELFARA